jgi:hypothetical protein
MEQQGKAAYTYTIVQGQPGENSMAKNRSLQAEGGQKGRMNRGYTDTKQR